MMWRKSTTGVVAFGSGNVYWIDKVEDGFAQSWRLTIRFTSEKHGGVWDHYPTRKQAIAEAERIEEGPQE